VKAMRLGRLSYDEAHATQVALRDALIAGSGDNTLLLLEHEPVMTYGRRGPTDDLRVSVEEIKSRGIEVRATERGGQTTYHGPGQLVGYVVGRLHDLAPDVPTYVWRIEDALIRSAATLGVTADRCHCGHGVWIGEQKLGSVGIAVSRGICWHGFALNVDVELSPFELIRPCGLDVEMTSLAKQGVAQSVEEVAAIVSHHLAEVLHIDMVEGDSRLPDLPFSLGR